MGVLVTDRQTDIGDSSVSFATEKWSTLCAALLQDMIYHRNITPSVLDTLLTL